MNTTAAKTQISFDASTSNDIAKSQEKLCLDCMISMIALLVLLPLFVIVALAIMTTSKGPVFFRQTRTGLYGKPFTILKFRTMTVSNTQGVKQAEKGDARVTAVGRILRATSIDELPQLLNVLKGDMSLVGPRPHAVEHDAYYAERIPTYCKRFAARPGLTGWAQVNDSRGPTPTLDHMANRVWYDVQYQNDWTLLKDIEILLKTPMALISTQSAF